MLGCKRVLWNGYSSWTRYGISCGVTVLTSTFFDEGYLFTEEFVYSLTLIGFWRILRRPQILRVSNIWIHTGMLPRFLADLHIVRSCVFCVILCRSFFVLFRITTCCCVGKSKMIKRNWKPIWDWPVWVLGVSFFVFCFLLVSFYGLPLSCPLP